MSRILISDDDRLLRGTVEQRLSEGDVAAIPDAPAAVGVAERAAASPDGEGAGADREGLSRGPLRGIATFIPRWWERRAGCRRLPGVSDHLLKDMGLSRRDVECEARRGWFDK